MGAPIIIWPPCGGSDQDPCQAELGSSYADCSEWYVDDDGGYLEPGQVACCIVY